VTCLADDHLACVLAGFGSAGSQPASLGGAVVHRDSWMIAPGVVSAHARAKPERKALGTARAAGGAAGHPRRM